MLWGFSLTFAGQFLKCFNLITQQYRNSGDLYLEQRDRKNQMSEIPIPATRDIYQLLDYIIDP